MQPARTMRLRAFRGVSCMVACLALGAGPAAALTPQEIFNYRGADREQMLIEGAKKEGQVVLYSALIVNQMLRPLTAGFTKKYPFVKMTYWRADSEELLPKLSAEMRADNVVADLFEGTGGGEIAVEAGFTQPFYSPELADYPKMYLDPKGHLAPTRLSYFSIAYNTKLVPADKVPKTYEDLLDPQWKGKMAWPYANTGRYLFMINLRLAWGEDKAMAYFKKLAEQKIVNFASGSARTLVDRVIAGEYPIAHQHLRPPSADQRRQGRAGEFAAHGPGAERRGHARGGQGREASARRHAADGFHPREEGQEIMSKADYFPAHPDVEVAPQLAGSCPKRAGYKENFVNPQQLKEQLESTDKILQELFR